MWTSSEIAPLPPCLGAGGEGRPRVPSFAGGLSAGRSPWTPLPRGSVLGDHGGLWGLVHDTVMGVAFNFPPGPLSLGPCHKRVPHLLVIQAGWSKPPAPLKALLSLHLFCAYQAGQGKLAGTSWSPLRPGQLGWWDCPLLPRHRARTPMSPRLCWCRPQGHPASSSQAAGRHDELCPRSHHLHLSIHLAKAMHRVVKRGTSPTRGCMPKRKGCWHQQRERHMLLPCKYTC